MSAYICSDRHIATIATAYCAALGEPIAEAQRIADDLLAENVHSYNHRYREHETITACDIAQAGSGCSPGDIVNLCRCLSYQSCETPDYAESAAGQLIERIRVFFTAQIAITGRRDVSVEWDIEDRATPAPAATAAAPVADVRAQLIADHPYLLVRGERNRGGTFAAKNIRILLKRSFPGVKFRVRSDYDSVRVRWDGGPNGGDVDSVIGIFEAGRFNAATDCYEYSTSLWNEVFGDCRYVFCARDGYMA